MTPSQGHVEDEHHDLLVTEMTHRFHNSLQVITSLLSRVTRAGAGPDVLVAQVAEIRERVAALSDLHRRLAWRSKATDSLADHCRQVCSDLAHAFGQEELRLCIAMDEVFLSAGEESRLVFLLAELVTNAMKHGRRDGGAIIWVDVHKDGRGEIDLFVRDNGEGAPSAGEVPKVADALARSLGGELTIASKAGYSAHAHLRSSVYA